MPINYNFHTGIQRDENQVWRRSSDGVEVNLEGWYRFGTKLAEKYSLNYPRSDADSDFVYWKFANGLSKNTIWNAPDLSFRFICEY